MAHIRDAACKNNNEMSQREVEKAVREALAEGKLKGNEKRCSLS
jgi:hypothetical protein